ncbi:TonB-dependent hemoglobin/transferrin/lactoferrin family receptor [Pseudochrobactrum asaccharolyticum]|uniref:Heme transporter BhuA n=1 Tax=Pseudochrobactrum asaccharolyticum TaxID=354351 RepID=A0A366EBB5_9HYPH|nr:TonB-dependent hemoglobin/transferrin/lactoferrin family receptor [Pseudochrobactrum asaccharolyticum]RBO99049.1 hemoglobin/transferrin/lactoferrin receptor protein [Pseudochrobactrum asaccharolyticum]
MSAYAAGGSASGARTFSCLQKFTVLFLTSTVLSSIPLLSLTAASVAQTKQSQPAATSTNEATTAQNGTVQLNTITLINGIVAGDGSYGTAAPNVAALDTQAIEKAQASSLPELLKSVPGVALLGGVRIQGQGIAIRGFGRQTDVRVILDGARKNFEQYDQGTIFIEPELLKSVEIEKGSTSVKYGNGGFGGTIKMETRSAADMLRDGESWGAWLKTGYQSANRGLTESAAVYGRSDFGTPVTYDGLAAVTWRKGDDVRVGGGERYTYSNDQLTSFTGKASATVDNHELTAAMRYGTSDNWGPVAAIRGQIVVSQYDIDKYGYRQALLRRLSWREFKDVNGSLEYKYHGDSDLVDARIMLSYSSTQLDTSRPTGLPNYKPSASTGGQELHSLYSDLHLEAENTSKFQLGGFEHSVNYGVQLNKHRRKTDMFDISRPTDPQYNYGHYAPWFMPGGKQDSLGIYAYDKITITDQLTLIPGIRYDYIRTEGTPNAAPRFNNPKAGHDFSAVSHDAVTPAFSVVYEPTSNLQFFADWAYSFRAPNIDETFSNQSDLSSAPGTSRQLKGERNNNINIGVKADFDQVFSDDDMLSLKASVYYNHVTDQVWRRFGSANLPKGEQVPFYWNIPSFYTKGFELSANYDTSNYFANIRYSYMDGKRHGLVNNVYSPNDTYIHDLAPNTLSTTLGWKVAEYDLMFGWVGTFVAKQHKTAYNQGGNLYARKPSDAYNLHDVFLDWTPRSGMMKDTELHLAVENIFDKYYEPYLSDGISAMPGRNFKVSLSRKF